MKRFLTLVMVSCVLMGTLYASPAYREAKAVIQLDGTTLTIRNNGDEFFHYYTTLDGILVKKDTNNFYYYAQLNEENNIEKTAMLAHDEINRSESEKAFIEAIQINSNLNQLNSARKVRLARQKAPLKKAQVTNHGDVNVPILLVQFADKKFSATDPNADFNDMANGENYKKDGAYGSIKEYFVKQSDGKFTPTFDVVGPVTLDNDVAYYGANNASGNDVRSKQMVIDACTKAENLTDFTKFDNNNDNVADVVYIIYAGKGEASGGSDDTIWPHQSSIGYSSLSVDGVAVNTYACSNEMTGDKVGGMGTFCHEFSHCIGLPDFYDTSSSGQIGMAYWSLMSSGNYLNNGYTPCGYTAFEKASLNWATPEVITEPTSITTETLANGGKSYKLVNPLNSNEYYFIDYRKQEGFDKALLGHGMMVVHVDYSSFIWSYNSVNNTAGHERCTILCADNNRNKYQFAAAGDLFPGTKNNTSITDATLPAFTWFTESNFDQIIRNIKENEDGTLSFEVDNKLETPSVEEATEVNEAGFTANWSSVDNAASYELEIIKEQSVNPTLEEGEYVKEPFDKVNTLQTNINLSATINNYTYASGWVGNTIFGADKKLRIGNGATQGYLITPSFDADGTISIDLDVQKVTGTDDTKFFVCLDAASNVASGYIDQKGYDLSSHGDTDVVHLQCTLSGATKGSFVILKTSESGKQRQLIIDNLVVKTAEQTTSDAPLLTKAAAYSTSATTEKTGVITKAANSTIISDITDTSYKVTGLEAGATYTYRVKAVDGVNKSEYSTFALVSLSTSGLAEMEAATALYTDGNTLYFSATKQEPVTIYSPSGFVVKKVITREGVNSIVLQKGLYLVQIGTTVQKIFIRQD
ncbi:MAG: M6 family metalloprotease domain-containing protein [Bacteroidaceae bacterium]